MNVNTLTYRIIGLAYKVHNTLGAGFIENVYENALKIELNKIGISALQQEDLDVFYEGQRVGRFTPDSVDSQYADYRSKGSSSVVQSA